MKREHLPFNVLMGSKLSPNNSIAASCERKISLTREVIAIIFAKKIEVVG